MDHSQRHQELVDQRFLRGLTAAEEAELAELARRLDEEVAPYDAGSQRIVTERRPVPPP